MPPPVIRFRIDFSENSNVGPGKINLLEAIRECGSLSQAARELGMSYRRAWLLLESLNDSFRDPPTVATRGGKGGGGVQLTPFGETLVRSYRTLEAHISQAAATDLRVVASHVSCTRANPVAADRRSPVRRPLARKKHR